VKGPVVDKVWSGIIGNTPDYLPLVCKLPASITGRGNVDGGEWIAAGYNGYGMVQCWSCCEAIARMALGEATPDWLPDVKVGLIAIVQERFGSYALLLRSSFTHTPTTKKIVWDGQVRMAGLDTRNWLNKKDL
jgi:hypothetical protein